MTNNFFKNNYTAVLGSESRPGPDLGSRSNTGPGLGLGSTKSGRTRPGLDHGQSSGRSIIKSIEQLANGLVDFAPSVGMYAGFAGDLLILNCWQVPHPDT